LNVHRGSSADTPGGSRVFHPSYYADIFRELGVTTVVRLNEARYDAGAFTAAGIEHHDLFFEDCTEPPGPIVQAFLAIVDAARGAVAVHCGAGGDSEWPAAWMATLAAAFLISRFGFAGPEAAAWVHLASA
jgi:cell division cycle 14